MLLLRDFFRFAASVLPTSIVAFSLSDILLAGDCPPMDLRVRRVAGIVASPVGDILTDYHWFLARVGCEAVYEVCESRLAARLRRIRD